jgi:hypothetical protein
MAALELKDRNAMPARPVLILMCGLSFAGKTTLALALATYKGWRYISLDTINEERGVGAGDEPITKEEWIETYAEAYDRVEAALAVGESVVYDETNMLRSQRDELRRIAALRGAEAYVLYVVTTAVEARQRWQHNRRTAERGDVRDDDFAYVVAHFEPPEADERMLRYDTSLDRESWIRQNFDGLRG